MEEILCNEGHEKLERVAQKGSGGPSPRNVQGQVGWGSEKPDLVEDVLADCRGLDQVMSKGPFQPKAFLVYLVVG